MASQSVYSCLQHLLYNWPANQCTAVCNTFSNWLANQRIAVCNTFSNWSGNKLGSTCVKSIDVTKELSYFCSKTIIYSKLRRKYRPLSVKKMYRDYLYLNTLCPNPGEDHSAWWIISIDILLTRGGGSSGPHPHRPAPLPPPPPSPPPPPRCSDSALNKNYRTDGENPRS